jgi:hypothetical protein
MSKLTVEVSDKTRTEENNYPKLMVSNEGQIVLFNEVRKGMNINGKGWAVGYYTDCWVMSCFKNFHGSVTLTQE